MKYCDQCFATVSERDDDCPSCGTRLAPESPHPPVAVTSEGAVALNSPIAAASLAASEPEPVDTRAPCPKHPDRFASGACIRCGTFYCLICEPESLKGKPLTCAACVKAVAPAEEQKLLREFLISSVVLSVLVVGLPALAMGSTGVNPRSLGLTMMGAFAGLTLLVPALLLRVTRRSAFAWVLFAAEVLVFGVPCILAPSACTFVLALAVCGFTLRSAVRLGELQHLVSPSQIPAS